MSAASGLREMIPKSIRERFYRFTGQEDRDKVALWFLQIKRASTHVEEKREQLKEDIMKLKRKSES